MGNNNRLKILLVGDASSFHHTLAEVFGNSVMRPLLPLTEATGSTPDATSTPGGAGKARPEVWSYGCGGTWG